MGGGSTCLNIIWAKLPGTIHMASGRCCLSTLDLFGLLLLRLCHCPGTVPPTLAWAWFPTSVNSASPLSLYPKPHKRKELPRRLRRGPLSQVPLAVRSSSAFRSPLVQQDSIADVYILPESGPHPGSVWFQVFVCHLLLSDSWAFPEQSSGPESWHLRFVQTVRLL